MSTEFDTKMEMTRHLTLEANNVLMEMWSHGNRTETLNVYLQGVLAPVFAIAMQTKDPTQRLAVVLGLVDLVQERTTAMAKDSYELAEGAKS